MRLVHNNENYEEREVRLANDRVRYVAQREKEQPNSVQTHSSDTWSNNIYSFINYDSKLDYKKLYNCFFKYTEVYYISYLLTFLWKF